MRQRWGGVKQHASDVAIGASRAARYLQRLERVFAYYPRLERVREFVGSHPSQLVSQRDCAQVAGYEVTYFSSWFHKRVGLQFRCWLRLVKVSKAAELLGSREYAIWEVAQAVGFRSVRTFERAFLKVMNVTPKAFRMAKRPS